ncbi:MAG: hypothetical protein ACD_79C00274G0006 [uncultured bacterium]|nr:MAG: hypothetical protein ACD_79C00274G0006 [uncultured bacterium]
MRPIEVIHSIERQELAKELQTQHDTDPFKSTGDLNVKKIHDNHVLENTSAPESEKKDAINPDEKNNNPKQNSSRKSKDKSDKDEDEPHKAIEPDKGNVLDIIA